MYTCPVCKRRLINLGCDICGYGLNHEKHSIILHREPADYMGDILDSIRLFIRYQPVAVVSRHPLFDVNFKLRDCYFICDETVAGTRNRYDDDLIHLIAGGGYLAADTKNRVYKYLEMHSQEEPLDAGHVYKDSESAFYEHVLLASVKYDKKSINDAVNLYMSPMLESVAAYFDSDFGSYLELTDEQALFTQIYLTPNLRIKWCTNEADLIVAVKENFRGSLEKLYEYKPFVGELTEYQKHYSEMLLYTSPSIAGDQVGAPNVSYVDVSSCCDVRQEAKDYAPEDLVVEDDESFNIALECIFKLTNNLFRDVYKLYGYKSKVHYLEMGEMPPEEMADRTVIKFWKAIYNKIFV